MQEAPHQVTSPNTLDSRRAMPQAGVVGVRMRRIDPLIPVSHAAQDRQGQREGPPAVGPGHHGGRPVPCRPDEPGQLAAERLLVRRRRPLEADLRPGRGLAQAVDPGLAGGEIDRDVRPGREDELRGIEF